MGSRCQVLHSNILQSLLIGRDGFLSASPDLSDSEDPGDFDSDMFGLCLVVSAAESGVRRSP